MSMLTYQRILVVTDGLKTSESTHETAFNLAQKHGAQVQLVDTLQPPNTTSKWLSPNASDVFEMVLADKQQRLDKIAETFRQKGIQTETKVLLGKSSEAITAEAIKWEASLVVRYMKGVRSKFPGLFGNTARSLMRFCPTPLLLVGKDPVADPNVLACLDTSHSEKENTAIMNESWRMAGERERLQGLYCWEMYGRDMIQKRMNNASFKESLEYAASIYRKSFETFCNSHDLAFFGGGVRIENGEPSLLIPQFCRNEGIDVVVMCSATLNHPLRRYFGSTVEAVIEQLPCSLLVVKPIGFISPLAQTIEESATA